MSERKRATNLQWLKWFYANADLGPAESDIKVWLRDRFRRETGLEVPRAYDPAEEEEDYD